MRLLLAVSLTLSLFAATGAAPARDLPPEAQAQAQARHAAQAAPSDPLAWLGPLPPGLDLDTADQAFQGALLRIQQQLRAEVPVPPAVGDFACRTPESVGEVPDLDALQRFVAAYPASESDPVMIADVMRAAARGNWLARSWLIDYQPDGMPAESRIYRNGQLLDWLLDRRNGAAYMHLARVLGGIGGRGLGDTGRERLQTLAANRGSYRAQFELGSRLRNDADPVRAEAGRRMLACAANALPGYERLFTPPDGARYLFAY